MHVSWISPRVVGYFSYRISRLLGYSLNLCPSTCSSRNELQCIYIDYLNLSIMLSCLFYLQAYLL
jgi:hypothetical protein